MNRNTGGTVVHFQMAQGIFFFLKLRPIKVFKFLKNQGFTEECRVRVVGN